MKASALPNDELVKFFIALRDQRSERKKEFETADDADKAKQEKIEAILLQRYQEQGIESARTAFGTAYKTTVGYSSVADKEVFMDHVKAQQAWELLEVRCSKDSVKQYIEEHKDLPPGVNWRTEVHIRVQRS